MRKFAAGLLALALLAGLGFTSLSARTAKAAPLEKVLGGVAVKAWITPESLSAPGQVLLTLEIQNNNADAITGITLTGDAQSNLEQVAAGEKQVITRTVDISEEQIGQALNLTLRWTGDRLYEMPLQLPVGRALVQPEAQLERTASQTLVKPGEEVTLTYVVTNTGNVPLQNLILTDPILGTVANIASLAVGDSQTVEKKVLLQTDLTSEPKVVYTYQGIDYSKQLDPLALLVKAPRLKLTLSADKTAVQAGDHVLLTCNIVNEGNVAVSKITVQDARLGELVKDQIVEPGKTLTITRDVTVQQKTSFLFTLNGVTPDEQPYVATSNEQVISLISQTDTISLAITVTSDVENLPAPGKVNFEIKLLNNGNVDLIQLVVREEQAGQLRVVESLGVGQDTLIRQTMDIEQTRSLVFTVTVRDAQGNEKTITANPVQVVIGAMPTPTPTTTATLDIPEIPLMIDDQIVAAAVTVMKVVAVLAALVAAGALAVWVTMKSRKPKPKQTTVKRMHRRLP